MLIGDAATWDMAAELIADIIDNEAFRQLLQGSPVDAIGACIVRALDDQANGARVHGHHLRIVAHDGPNPASGSQPPRIGPDLYIGLRVTTSPHMPTVAKGLLIHTTQVQEPRVADEDGTLRITLSARAREHLRDRCRHLLQRSDKGAFVWVYREVGTHVVPASEVLVSGAVPPECLDGRGIGALIRDAIDGFAGDQALVAPEIFDDEGPLGAHLGALAVPRGVAIEIAPA